MLNNPFKKKKKTTLTPPRPRIESEKKFVSAKRFNDMINYYTNELKSRISEINRLKEENDMLIKTSIKGASRSDELRRINSELSKKIFKLNNIKNNKTK